MKRILFFGFLICFQYQVFSQEFETYECKDKKYSIDLPNGWVTGYDKNALVSVLVANDTADLTKRLTVVTSKTTALSTKEAYNVNLRSIKGDKKNTIENEGSTVINGMEAYWAVYSFTTDEVKMLVKMYVLKNGRMQYLVQSVIPADTFDSSVEYMDKIIHTFKTL